MNRPIQSLAVSLVLIGALASAGRAADAAAASTPAATLTPYRPSGEELRQAYERADQIGREARGKVFKAQLTPHWLSDNRRFWYRNELRDDKQEFILVDAEQRTRRPAFDHARLAQSLAQAAGAEYRAEKLPFNEIEFVDDAKAIRFRAGETTWRCELESYACTKVEDATAGPARVAYPSEPRFDGRRRFGRRDEPEGTASPDGKWTARVRDYNVVVRAAGASDDVVLSDNGQPDFAYGELNWSPDSKTLVGWRIEPATTKDVYLIESSPATGGRAKLRTMPYGQPGDKMSRYELWLFDLEAKTARQAALEPIDFQGPPRPHWLADGRRFTLQRTDRGHQRFRVVEVDARTGQTRNLIDQRSQTFINGVGQIVRHLEKSNEIVWSSERDGWNHLYLVNGDSGELRAITQGPWVVRGIERIDEDARQVWFSASGMYSGQDPYLVHYYRIGLDGSGLTELTPCDGNHTVQFSPDRRWLIDSYSRVDQPPIHELRRTADGSLVCELERADVSALVESGWQPPEVFCAKGRDGQTDIWGVVCRPRTLDPAKKYPVIENIYAGPQDSHVPKNFSGHQRMQSLAELGFIVVQIDGMGTANRSKAFHDVCWRNLADAGLPDRIAWIKALAQRYAYVDAERAGIYGTSAGGQNAAGAVLFHPEFYDVAVASCGCHDNRLDKTWWNEQWMGYPVGPHYAAQSNITNAHRLRGKLMLIVGELDTNVPPESTFRFADALIKAGKDFELLVLPGVGHSDGGPYGERRRRDFFVRHLHGVEPPERNQPNGQSKAANIVDSAAVRKPNSRWPGQSLSDAPESTSQSSGRLPPQPPSSIESASELRELIEQYDADRRSLSQQYGNSDWSPVRRSRLNELRRQTLAMLAALDFDKLGRDGQIDHLLLKNHVTHELRQSQLDVQAQTEMAPLAPFLAAVVELEDARRRMAPIDSAKIAAQLNDLTKQIEAARRELGERLKSDTASAPKTSQGYRAARAIGQAQRMLRHWFGFYDGYDPLFSWWAASPYKQLDQALGAYANFLRERIVGARADGKEAIVGEPIGREALLSELAAAWICYTPEELLAIAEREFAWCDGEMRRAAADMGCGDDWKKALEQVKRQHVEPGKQPDLIRGYALEAIAFVDRHDLVTVPPLARETWRIEMMSPEQQLVNPFFTGGRIISVSFPTGGMTHEQKQMTMRGNNIHFARATVFHEVIPGHHLQQFMMERHRTYRHLFGTPFWMEGWALYWEMLMWDLDFPQSPENRVGMLFWRMHRCARIIFSLKFHLEQMTPQECIDFLVDRVGHERQNAAGEVRRSFGGSYEPLYQAAYMLGGLQLRALHRELVESGKLSNREFHDAVLRENSIPIELIRAKLTGQALRRDAQSTWKFYGDID